MFVVLIGFGIAQLALTASDWHLRDMGAYWEAGDRVRLGEPLYPRLLDSEASTTYRYAPWFAWLWAPITSLPREVVSVAWSVLLVSASVAALVPAVRRRAWLVVILFAPILIGISAIGNAHPLLIAALIFGVERRTGPLWIAAAASLKLVPILFVLTYVGRREWGRALATVGLTAVFVAPTFLYDLTYYPTESGPAAGLIAIPLVYALAVVAGCAITIRLAGTRLAWLASSASATLAVPRLFVYDISYVLIGIPDAAARRDVVS